VRRWLLRAAAVLVVAAAVHVGVIWALPRAIMGRLALALDARGGRNTALHPPRPDDSARGVVMPSPDLLYSICAFDLSDAPLRVTAPAPQGYWSVALFAENSDNFFVQNDRSGKPVDFILTGPGKTAAPPPDVPIIQSPSVRGIVLFRLFVPTDAALAALTAAQREQRCQAERPYAAAK
jgi:uncharacterized membrane protein